FQPRHTVLIARKDWDRVNKLRRMVRQILWISLSRSGVVGEHITIAQQELQAAGFSIGNITMESDGLPAGDVANQYPAAGTLLPPGSSVDLYESNGQS